MSDKLKKFWSLYNFIVVFLIIFIAYLIINGSAPSWTTITNILLHSSILGTIALGQALIVLTGDIDLSVGSSFVLAGGIAIVVFNSTNSIFLLLLCCLALGAAFGFINGLMVGKFKMPSFIVTLATMLIYRSLSQYMMNEMGETRYRVDASLSKYYSLFNFGNGSFLTISLLSIVWILLAVFMIYMTNSMKYGKRIYALGSNPKGAMLAGVNVVWTKISVFVLCGLTVGLSTFMKIAKDTSFDPATSGKNYELYSIAAVVIGGISMSGGRGKILGVVFGTMSFTLIDKIITALGMNALLNDTVKGVILLAAVGLQMIQKKSRD